MATITLSINDLISNETDCLERAYFVSSAGNVSSEIIQQYIKEQEK